MKIGVVIEAHRAAIHFGPVVVKLKIEDVMSLMDILNRAMQVRFRALEASLPKEEVVILREEEVN
jgi:hypothetical protein